MNYEKFRFYEKVSRFEDTVTLLTEQIENLSEDIQYGNITQKLAEQEKRGIEAGVNQCGKRYLELLEMAPDGEEELMQWMKNWMYGLRKSLEGISGRK